MIPKGPNGLLFRHMGPEWPNPRRTPHHALCIIFSSMRCHSSPCTPTKQPCRLSSRANQNAFFFGHYQIDNPLPGPPTGSIKTLIPPICDVVWARYICVHACSVKRTEAERYIESQPTREKLRADVLQHLREKGIDLDLPASKP